MKKFLLLVIVIVVVILLCIYIPKKDVEVENEVQNTSVENTISEASVENKTVTEISNKTEAPASNAVTNLPISTNDAYKEGSDVGTTEKKQEAIDLVKKTWGEDKTVTFRCDSITSDGEYIIAVVSKETAAVKNYFRVNLETRDVDVDY